MMRALVVDDDLSDIMMLKKALAAVSPDIDIHTCTSVGDARKLLLRCRFDIIFLDVRVPPEDGIVFLEEIRNSQMLRLQKVVMVSGVDGPLDRLAARSLNTAFFVKPIAMVDVKRLIAECGHPPI